MTTCPNCGAGYDPDSKEPTVFKLCLPCAIVKNRVNIPKQFCATDVSRLPSAQHAEVIRWRLNEESGRGLVLVGPSGVGKTRCMWELVKALAGVEVKIFSCVQFGQELSVHYREETAEEWLVQLGSKTPVLMLDDLGKLKMTERVEAELFGIIDSRYANMLPIIATTQITPADLTDSAGSSRGAAMVRRLIDSCDIVQF